MTKVLAVSLIAMATACAACTNVSPANTRSDAQSGGSYSSVSTVPARPAARTTIPSGARLRVVLIDAVSPTKSAPGDRFLASLVDPVIIGGRMVLERGTTVRGRVVDVKGSSRAKVPASIRLVLTDIILDGKSIAISTGPLIAGGAGTWTVLAANTKELHFPAETRLSFTLANSVEI